MMDWWSWFGCEVIAPSGERAIKMGIRIVAACLYIVCLIFANYIIHTMLCFVKKALEKVMPH